MSDDITEHGAVVQWLDYMTGRLDEYEIERNEYLSAYGEQAPASFRFFQDVVLGFAENTLLMDNLAAGREEIQYVAGANGLTENRLRLRTFIEGEELKAKYHYAVALAPESDEVDGTDGICYPDRFPYLLRHRDFDGSDDTDNLNQALQHKEIVVGREGEEAEDVEEGGDGTEDEKDKEAEDKDVEVVLPNVHTFYSVLENFIRNSAKHAEHLSDRKRLNVYLYVTNPGPDKEYYDLFLYDDVSEVTAEEAVGFQLAIESELIGSDGDKSEESSLGIADMKFSSFLMVDSDPSEMTEEKLSKHLSIVAFHGKTIHGKTKGALDEDQYTVLREPEGSEASKEERVEALKGELDNGETCNFGYCFKLVKSKKVCWIGSHLKDHEASLRPRGIYRYDSLDAFKNPDGERTIAAFDFAVIEPAALTKPAAPDDVSKEAFERALMQFPYRVLLAGSADDGPDWLEDWLTDEKHVNDRRVQQTKTDPPASQPDMLLRWCWHEWLRRWKIGEGKCAQVHLYTEADEGVERWRFDDELDFEPDFGDVELKLHSKDSIESGETSLAPPGDDVRLTVYDRHGGLLKNGVEENKKSVKGRFQQPTDFCASFDKNSTDFARLFYPPKRPESREYMLYQLVEAGQLRVLVLDERIAKLARKRAHRSMKDALGRGRSKKTFWYQAAASNVFLVTQVEDSKVAEGGQTDARFVDLRLNVKGGISLSHGQKSLDVEKYADVLIIHRTFAKSMAKQIDSDSVKDLVNRLREKIPWVIVDSGTSHSLDPDALFKFMPYSQLEQQIEQVGASCVLSKVQLAQRIMTLTRTHE